MRPVDFDPFADGHTLPLTVQQREMLAVTQMGDTANCAYNECFVLGLRGPLSRESLCEALAACVGRHEALRVRIGQDGEHQEIVGQVDVTLPLLDLSTMDATSRHVRLAQAIAHELETPFDLTVAPLWRVQLIRESARQHRLVFTVHHLIVDGWSSTVLFGDIAKTYAANRLGLMAQLPEPASYSAFVMRSGSASALEEARAHQDYWVSQFASGVPDIDLPLDHPRPRVKTFASARELVSIDADLCHALRRTGAQHGASLFVTLLAAFEVLLARLSGCTDFVLGVPMASQAIEDNGHLVAHGVNTIPLRCHVDSAQAFLQHLRNVRGTVIEAQSHQRLTFGSLVQRLNLPRDPGRTPLVSLIFNMDRLDTQFDFGDVAVDSIEVPKAFSNFDLSINAVDEGAGVRIACDYNPGLWNSGTISRWLGHYRTLLASVASESGAIADLPLLSDLDRVELREWNETTRPYPSGATLHTLVEQQAARTPDAVALVHRTEQITFGELDREANRLAQVMRARGIGRGSLVGLCLERSLRMVVSQLAILKAGAAYVPLDPSFPLARLDYMTQDAGLALLLTESTLVSQGRPSIVPHLLLDADAPAIAALEGGPLKPDPTRDARAADPAYVLYTSGSTGQPKGVVVPHRAVVNFLTSMAAEPGIGQQDRLVAVTTLGFDISVLEILLPLTAGARVIVADREDTIDGWALRRLLQQSEATFMQGTPGTWRLLLEAGWKGAPGFKALIGGEPLPRDLAIDLLQCTAELWNMYGPTETTVWSTCWKVQNPERGIFIGTPIANTYVYILDQRLQICPVGVPGEIYIGGDGVATGYWNRGELTTERFVPDPFRMGSTLYRTGDRGRWRLPGLLEHLGRLDSQLKIRGFRIEPGEIEARLNAHPSVMRAVVVARQVPQGDERLIAYVVPRETMPSASALREDLAARLPDYMVPQHFVAMERIPVLPNGKLDARALPMPDVFADGAGTTPVAPRTSSEALVTSTFSEVLHRADVGVLDNFFDLGGQSLMAARVITRLRAATGVDLPLRNLFEHPTSEGLARAIDALAWVGGAAAGPKGDRAREDFEL